MHDYDRIPVDDISQYFYWPCHFFDHHFCDLGRQQGRYPFWASGVKPLKFIVSMGNEDTNYLLTRKDTWLLFQNSLLASVGRRRPLLSSLNHKPQAILEFQKSAPNSSPVPWLACKYKSWSAWSTEFQHKFSFLSHFERTTQNDLERSRPWQLLSQTIMSFWVSPRVPHCRRSAQNSVPRKRREKKNS